MERIVAAIFLMSAVTVFGHVAFGQAKTEKGSSAQDLMIKGEVETAVSMLQTIFSKYQKGDWTLEQSKQLGAEFLRGLRYGKDGYFWADTTEGVNVVLYGRKDVEGKNRLETKDDSGKFFVKDFIARARAGGGFVNYRFPKMNQTAPLPKRAYVQLFEPFGWVVGTGYYLASDVVTKGETD